MVLNKKIWVAVGFIIVAFTSILVYARLHNEQSVTANTYQTWQKTFVTRQSDQATYVNAGVDGKKMAMSEAQGLGMLITAQAGRKGWASQTDFDHLLAYYQQNRLVVANQQTHLMNWRQRDVKGAWRTDTHSATDGDLYIAYALQVAASVWPKQATTYNTVAKAIAADILRYEYNDQQQLLTVGDWATADTAAYRLMRTSDVMPSVFASLAKLTNDKRWGQVSDSMLTKLATLSKQHKTGLVPDFAVVTKQGVRAAKAKEVATKQDGHYAYNAARVPMMLADSSDQRAVWINRRLMHFFDQQTQLLAGYTVTGKALHKYESNVFSAPIFYAAQSDADRYGKLYKTGATIYNRSVAQQPYYDATLTALVAVGGFKND